MNVLLQITVCGVLSVLFAVTAAMAMEPVHTGFASPTGIAVTGDGAMYVSNWSGGTVERISANGARQTIVTGIGAPAGVTFNLQGQLFVASYSDDYIVRVSESGGLTKVAEGLATPTGIAFSSDGRLLVANRSSGEIVAVDTETGEKQVIADGLSLPVGVVEMPDKSLVVSQYGGRVTRIVPDGSRQELGASFSRPGVGILADGPDAVLVIDNGADVVRRVDFAGQSRVFADGFSGSAVALGRAANGDILVGTWGAGQVYRIVR